MELKGEIAKLTIIIDDFNNFLSIISRTGREKQKVYRRVEHPPTTNCLQKTQPSSNRIYVPFKYMQNIYQNIQYFE